MYLFAAVIITTVLIIMCFLVEIFFRKTQIKKLEDNEMFNMTVIEKKYKKTYPLGNDKFSITHYPEYSSFFGQFKNYKYLVMTNCNKDSNEILATCCLAKINDINYICDLKSFSFGNSATYNFGKYVFLNYIMTFKMNLKFFGVVMEPNDCVNYIGNKYLFKKYCTLNLYQISYTDYVNNHNLINKIFPCHFFVEGYKKFVLESTGKFMNIYHIAQQFDSKYVKVQDKMIVTDLNTEVMFCLPQTNEFCGELHLINIKPKSLMSIIGIGCDDISDWTFIKTYMI